MSLLTRLWLAVLAAMSLALIGNLVVSTLSARNYLEQQLYAQANDSAASLALSMSQQSKDAAMTELLVSALFDSGHFESIVYRDVDGKALVERTNRQPVPDAPAWFVSLVPLQARAGNALVSDGWKQAGVVSVLANKRFAYSALWKGSLQTAGMLAVIGLLLGGLVTLLLRWVKRPLTDIVQQAEAIGERRFVSLPEPDVKELRIVVRAMNAMVARVQSMFAEQAARIDQLRDDANRDGLTELPNRNYLMGRLREALVDEGDSNGGTILMLRILDLAGVNRRLGRERTDALIKACGQELGEAARSYPDSVAARLNGADFALLLADGDPANAEHIARKLLDAMDDLHRREFTDRKPVVAVGWTTFRNGEPVADVLSRADAALMSAETLPVPLAGGGPAAGSQVSGGALAWRALIDRAIETRSFELATYPVVRTDGSPLHQEAMLRLKGEDGKLMSAGQFMPAASRFGLTGQLDLLAIELAIGWLERNPGDMAVNLSPLSLEKDSFLVSMKDLLGFAGPRASRLWFEVSERGLGDAHGVESIAALSRVLAGHQCKLGIEHFGRHFAAMPQLYALSVDYLKLDGGFVAGIDVNDGNQRFVKAAVDVARSLDISVIAERVVTEAEWQTLGKLGVAGLTGPAVTRKAG
ncbi:bifunctional diguanylate cyclase/phosphodiesterase [Uliginosibacterium sp. H1]|uniref:bifunctional diguanylate cyclase/phosphodiesterase n=1 Tax=Uliginosibacterium sp. H1 TaxID=3114757 RepID=UPI002E183BB5|nr:EAL domain-containing protein [Uliginosibacterium sp. H1]